MSTTCNENQGIGQYDIYFLVQLCYGIPSLYVWLRIIKAILIERSHASFMTPFHRILAGTGIISVVVFVNDMLFTRFLLTGRFCSTISAAFSSWSYWLSPTVFIAMYGVGCQCTGTILLSLNRLTAMWISHYKEVWSRHIVAAYIFLFAPSLLTSWYLIPALTIVRIENDGASMRIEYLKLFPWISTTLFSAIIFAVSCLIIFVLTILTLFSYRTAKRNTQSIDLNRFERAIFITGLVQTTTTLIFCLYQLAMYVLIQAGLNLKLQYLYTARSFVWDLLNLLPAWVTLAYNRPIRETFRFFRMVPFFPTTPRPPTDPTHKISVTGRSSQESRL